MLKYNLSPVPNQRFTISVEGLSYRFSLRYFRDMMYCTITDIDDIVLASNVRCTNNGWLLPFPFKQTMGNFRFENIEGGYPNYKDFKTTCSLVYYSAEDLETLKSGSNGD